MNPVLLEVPDHLQTQRVILRTPRLGDGKVVYPSVRASIEELKAWMPWATDAYNEDAAENWCRKAAANFLTRQQLQYCIFTNDGQHAGNLGAFEFDWAVPSCVIGYWLRTNLCGRGLMTEAVNALVGMLTSQLKMVRIQLDCDDRNLRSARVAERCGFTLDGVHPCASRAQDGSLRDTRTYSRIEKQP